MRRSVGEPHSGSRITRDCAGNCGSQPHQHEKQEQSAEWGQMVGRPMIELALAGSSRQPNSLLVGNATRPRSLRKLPCHPSLPCDTACRAASADKGNYPMTQGARALLAKRCQPDGLISGQKCKSK